LLAGVRFSCELGAQAGSADWMHGMMSER